MYCSVDTVRFQVHLWGPTGRRVLQPCIHSNPNYRESLELGQTIVVRSPYDHRRQAKVTYKSGNLSILGSPLTWSQQQNFTGSCDWVGLVKRWQQEVVDDVFPGCSIRRSRPTRLDPFAMIDCGSWRGVENTIAYFGSCLYTTQRRTHLYYGETSNTGYLGQKSRYFQVACYSKAQEIIDRSPVRGRELLGAIPTLPRCVRVESSLRDKRISNNPRFSYTNWERLDLTALFYESLGCFQEANPWATDRSGWPRLSPRDRERARSWLRGWFFQIRQSGRLYRDYERRVRRATGWDLGRNKSVYQDFNPHEPYLTIHDMMDPARNMNSVLWDEFRRYRPILPYDTAPRPRN